MNCPNCGAAVAPGMMNCPICNAGLGYAPQQWAQNTQSYQPVYQQGYQQDFAPQQNWQQQSAQPPMGNGYADYTGRMQPVQPQQNYMQQSAPAQQYATQGYQQQAYPGYQQGYPQNYGYQQPAQPNPLMTILTELPRTFAGSFTNPGEVLRSLVERGDLFTCPIVVGVVLVVVFLGGMAAMRGVVSVLFGAIASLTGISLASNDASMQQGINYIAGQVAPAVGGIAVLCQLIAIAVPVLVVLIYLCGVCKLPFSWHVTLGMVTVTTMPTVAFALLSMLLSFVSPWLCLLMMITGIVVAYLQLGNMITTITGAPETQLLPAKMICFPIAIVLTLVALWFVGGNLMGNVFQHMLSLLGNTGSFV